MLNDDTQTQKTVVEEVPPVAPSIAPAQVFDNTFGVNSPTTGDIPPIVSTPPKRGRKGIFIAMVGILLLVGAVGAGIVLVQQQQELREKAAVVNDINARLTVTNGQAASCTSLCTGETDPDTDSPYEGCVLFVRQYKCDSNSTGGGGCQENGQTVADPAPVGSSYGFDTSRTCGTQQIDIGCANPKKVFQSTVDFLSYVGPTSCTTGTEPPPSACTNCETQATSAEKGGTPTSQQCDLSAESGLEGIVCNLPQSACGGGVAPTPTPDTRNICGGSCTTDTDCKDATFPGVDVACRGGKCVNQQCYDRGGNTTPGTLCTCDKPAGLCGDSCGAAIGLCQTGYSCTYLAQSQCSPATQYPVCVPPGTATGQRGAMTGVPAYQGSSFERRACGATTADPSNNYIYHPAFATGVTQQQVRDLICNPTTPVGPSGQCLTVRIYDTSWNELNTAARTALKPGDIIRVTVAGSASQGAIDQARFTFNNSLRLPVTQKKPNTQEFYDEITIPAGTTSIRIEGEIHHPDLGWF